ncbi:cyclic nucleotide-binding domain-containing protein [Pontibacter populi]|uniref:Cyclic nucleotide-binding domain-containing protein n=1 Tax=Pontibacter populi TaxID=890055 RepID=A0ABV1RYL1_9BACT
MIGRLFDQLNPEVLDDLILKLDWLDLGRGEILCHQGEDGDSLYILITGRLRAIVGFGSNQEREVGEISPGETVGEMAMITGEPRTATIVALRDSCLVRLLKSDFDALIKRHPEVLLALSGALWLY